MNGQKAIFKFFVLLGAIIAEAIEGDPAALGSKQLECVVVFRRVFAIHDNKSLFFPWNKRLKTGPGIPIRPHANGQNVAEKNSVSVLFVESNNPAVPL